jgi:hypothetical protein
VWVLLCAIALAVGTSSAGWLDSVMGKDLDSLLSKQLGLTSDQSKGGIGAILGMAKEKLLAGDYDKLAEAIPGADGYLSKARKLGVLNSPITNTDGLNAAFEKLGVPKDKASQFVPAVTQLVGQAGGPEVQKILSGLLG